MTLTTFQKAEKLVKDGKIIPSTCGMRKQWYMVKGGRMDYRVWQDLETGQWGCDCNNIRLTPCKHIIGSQLYIQWKEGEKHGTDA